MSGKRGQGASVEKLEALRERVLRVSQELIEEQGLAALSMREVARRAGVSHQAPYNHFADRQAILAALAEEGFHTLRSRFRAVLDDAALVKEGPAAVVTAMGRAYLEFACAQPAHFRVMFRPELVDLEQCEGARVAGDCAFESLSELVAHVVDAGAFRGVAPEVVAVLIWSMAHGLACLVLDGPIARKLPNVETSSMIESVLTCFGQLVAAQLR